MYVHTSGCWLVNCSTWESKSPTWKSLIYISLAWLWICVCIKCMYTNKNVIQAFCLHTTHTQAIIMLKTYKTLKTTLRTYTKPKGSKWSCTMIQYSRVNTRTLSVKAMISLSTDISLLWRCSTLDRSDASSQFSRVVFSAISPCNNTALYTYVHT